jgi:hypothetical protein
MIKNEKQLLALGFFVSLVVLLAVAFLYFNLVVSKVIFKSIIFGSFISIINFLIGLSLVKFSINKSEKIFLISLWGGMLFRLIFGLSIVIISLIFLEINTYGFIFSILFFHIFYLIIEIFYLDLRRKNRFDGSKQS